MKKRRLVIASAIILAMVAGAVLFFALRDPNPSLDRYLAMFVDGDAVRTALAPLKSSDGEIQRVDLTLDRGVARAYRFPDGSFFWIERSSEQFCIDLDLPGASEYGRIEGGEYVDKIVSYAPLVVRGENFSAIAQPPLSRFAAELEYGCFGRYDQPTNRAYYVDGRLTVTHDGYSDRDGGRVYADWWIYLTPHDLGELDWYDRCTVGKFGGDNRMTIDGYFYQTPSDYVPSATGVYYRNPAAYIAGKLARFDGVSADGRNMAIAMLDIQRQYYNEQGFVPTAPLSNWLKSDYGVGAGFFDTRFNTELADALLKLGRERGVVEFERDALRHAEYLNAHALSRSTDDGAGGVFVDDYAHPDGCARTHCALNHQLAEALFLLKTGDEEYAATAHRMIDAVERSVDSWIREDGNLHYARYPDGTFGGADYPYLTYNDLLALDRYLGGSDALERLMASKREWMDKNGVTDYNR